jgi:hypothetical protein
MDFRRSLAYWAALVATYLCVMAQGAALVLGGFLINPGVGLVAVALELYLISNGLTGVTQYLLQRDYQRYAIAQQMERFRMDGEAAAGNGAYSPITDTGYQYDSRRV